MAHRHRLSRTVRGRAGVRRIRREVWPRPQRGRRDGADVGDEHHVRALRQLRDAVDAAAHSRHRRRWRDAGRSGVHQRAVEGERPRPVLSAIRADFSNRPDDDRAARRAARADARLAGDVSDRRHPRSHRDRAATAPARIASLADCEGTARGCGCCHPRDRGKRGTNRRTSDPGSRIPSPELGLSACTGLRAFRWALPHADHDCVDSLGMRVLHHQRAE